jgi:hypothetical protein
VDLIHQLKLGLSWLRSENETELLQVAKLPWARDFGNLVRQDPIGQLELVKVTLENKLKLLFWNRQNYLQSVLH